MEVRSFLSTVNCTKLSNAELLLQDKIRSAKVMYKHNLVCDISTPKNCNIYKYIQHLCQSNTLPAELYLNSKTAVTDADKADHFNSYFSSVFSCSSLCLPPLSTIPVPQSSLTHLDILVSDVYKELISNDQTKVMGFDEIHVHPCFGGSHGHNKLPHSHASHFTQVCVQGYKCISTL